MYLNILYYVSAYLIGAIPIKSTVGKMIKNDKYNFLIFFLKGMLIISFYKILGININVLWTIIVIVVIGNYFNPFDAKDKQNGDMLVFGLLFLLLPVEVLFSILVWFLCSYKKSFSRYKTICSMGVLLIVSSIMHPNMPEINTHTPMIIIILIVLAQNYKYLEKNK